MESTLKAIFISIFLTIILAASNTYLALKIGILPSASIPAAILAMGILRLFKNSNILEINLIQTTASAGQAVVGGIVYTAPSLIMIHYWKNFPYWQCVLLSFIGGTLGVLLSIPMRKKLVSDPKLPFPEGNAIVAVLQASTKGHVNFRKIITGGWIGALIDLFQSGFKVLAEDVQFWFIKGQSVFGFASGFSAAMIGTGYLIGINIGASLLVGGILGWVVGIPVLSSFFGISHAGSPADIAMNFWSSNLRYISIGAMIFAGLFSLMSYVKPFVLSALSFTKSCTKKNGKKSDDILDDLPFYVVFIGIFLSLAVLFIFFIQIFNLDVFNIASSQRLFIVAFFLLFIVVFGFIFSAISGYFSGLLGVSGSPGSGIIIFGALIVALLFKSYLHLGLALSFTDATQLQAEAIIIMITSILACIAAISCDNIQDLKVGHMIGATPWKQQLMLLFGILIVSIVTPYVMQVLLDVYGIAGEVNQHADPSQALSAPPAAMIASLVEAIFKETIAWGLIGGGALFVLVIVILNYFFNRRRLNFSILAIATGMYLPLTVTIPLFIGSVLSEAIKQTLSKNQNLSDDEKKTKTQSGFLIASGMLCGATLMQVILASIFAAFHSSDVLNIMPKNMMHLSVLLSISTIMILFYWVHRDTTEKS
jgi:putative OPT family oligopeptide transporter